MGEPTATDDLALLTRKLAEAHAALAALEEENARLRLGLGQPPAPSRLPAVPLVAGDQGYRTDPPLLRLERALSEADVAVADLSIENEVLRSRTQARPATARAFPWPFVLAAVATASGGTLVWFATESFVLLALLGLVLALGGGLVHLIGAIHPDGSNTRRPPYIGGF